MGTVAAMSTQIIHRSVFAPENIPFEDMDTSIQGMANSIELMSTPVPNIENYLKAFLPNQR
jgi:hypothetical protein